MLLAGAGAEPLSKAGLRKSRLLYNVLPLAGEQSESAKRPWRLSHQVPHLETASRYRSAIAFSIATRITSTGAARLNQISNDSTPW